MNKATDWNMIISEYKLDLCKRAVRIIGQETQKNVKKIEGQGLEDNSYNMFNLYASSVGTGVGILVVLFLIFKIIKDSNVQSWSAVGRCLFLCCRLSHRTSDWDHHNDTGITKILSNLPRGQSTDVPEKPRKPDIKQEAIKESGTIMQQPGHKKQQNHKRTIGYKSRSTNPRSYLGGFNASCSRPWSRQGHRGEQQEEG